MAQGGDNSLFLEESSEVIRGGQDGDSVVDETENIEVASDPSLEDSRNEMSLMLFGKPIHELTDEELQILNDQGAMPAQSPIMANQGGRVGLFRGAEADARAGIASMSPGTHHGGGGTLEFEAWKEMTLAGDHRPGEMAQGGIRRTGYAMGTEHPAK